MNLFIGSSSREEISDEYKKTCKQLLKKLAKLSNITLIFGADKNGLMGLSYKEFKQENKEVIGVTVNKYKEQLKDLDCSLELVKDTTMERFSEIYKRSDILLFLPGGIGTYAELLSSIEEVRTNDNEKLLIVYNVNYFYTPFINEMYSLYEKGFIDTNPNEYFLISNDIDEIVTVVENF